MKPQLGTSLEEAKMICASIPFATWSDSGKYCYGSNLSQIDGISVCSQSNLYYLRMYGMNPKYVPTTSDVYYKLLNTSFKGKIPTIRSVEGCSLVEYSGSGMPVANAAAVRPKKALPNVIPRKNNRGRKIW